MLGFCNVTILLHTLHIVCLFPFVTFLGDACAWAMLSSWRRLLSWRRLDWAMLSLGDAFFLGGAFFVAMPVAASNRKKIKTKNQGKVFLELVFSFYLGLGSGKGKRASPFTRLLHCCLHKSIKIKLQVGCIPTARDGTALQGL